MYIINAQIVCVLYGIPSSNISNIIISIERRHCNHPLDALIPYPNI